MPDLIVDMVWLDYDGIEVPGGEQTITEVAYFDFIPGPSLSVENIPKLQVPYDKE